MKAIVTVAFPGVKDGDVYPRDFNPGDIVEGSLAAEVVAAGWAEEIKAKPPAPLFDVDTDVVDDLSKDRADWAPDVVTIDIADSSAPAPNQQPNPALPTTSEASGDDTLSAGGPLQPDTIPGIGDRGPETATPAGAAAPAAPKKPKAKKK